MGALCTLAGGMTGCVWEWDQFNVFHTPKPPPGPADSLVLQGDRLEPETIGVEGTAKGDLAGAHELFRRGDYDKAEKVFHKIAENTKHSDLAAEEARYYEAECLRLQSRFPKAADTYNKLLMTFPSGAHREQAMKRMFDIANYWLHDTDEEMKAKQEGKHWFVLPTSFVHFEKAKPFLDEEGRAIEILDSVKINDMTGPLADKALWLAGTIKFFREDYVDADHYFSQLVEMHPNSPLTPKAVELAIISKNLSTGGPDYDCRKTAEARKMVHEAIAKYPELAKEKEEFLQRQLVGINMQQAEKDFRVAEFYRRTKHPGSAYFYYEIVRRRYPGTPLADKAAERMKELEAQHEKDEAKEKSKPIINLPFLTPSKPDPAAAPRQIPPLDSNALPPVAGPAGMPSGTPIPR
jgi:outer membrane protein assembly factor BamD (BamD/ComL family)